MTDYYVKKISGVLYYKQGEYPENTDTSATDLEAISNAIGATDTMILYPDTYSGTDLGTDNSFRLNFPQTIRSENPTACPKTITGLPVFDGSADAYSVDIRAAATVSGVAFINAHGAFSNIRNGSGGVGLVQNCIFTNGTNAGYVPNESFTFKNNSFINLTGYNNSILILIQDSDATETILYQNYFYGNNCPITINKGDTNTYNICHNVFAGSIRQCIGIYTGYSPTVNIDNNIFAGNLLQNDAGTNFDLVLNDSSGTVTLNNNLILSGISTTRTILSTVTNNNPVYDLPHFVQANKPGIFLFGVDDYANISYAESLSEVFTAKNQKMYYAVDTRSINAAGWETLNTMRDAGHEIVSHTKSHSKLAESNAGGEGSAILGGITISAIPGAETATISDGVLSITGQTDIDLSKYTITALATLIDGLAGFSCSISTASTQYTTAASLADVTDESLPGSLDLDQVRHLDYELGQSKADIEANISGYTCASFVHPTDGVSSEVREGLFRNGYTSARGDVYGGQKDLSEINPFNIYSYNLNTFLLADTPSNDDLSKRIKALCEISNYAGYVISGFCHNAADVTIEQWGIILDAVIDSNCSIMTPTEFLSYVTSNASGDTGVEGEKTYTRTITPAYGMRISPTSPCIDAGTTIAGVTDIGTLDPRGNATNRTPNIGADQASDENFYRKDAGFDYGQGSYMVRVKKIVPTA